jgi:alkaline phosphatase D
MTKKGPPTLSRRDALRLGAAAASLALLPAAGCAPGEAPELPHKNSAVDPSVDGGEDIAFDADALPHDEALFALPVSAGAMRASSALVHGHTSDGAPKRLRVWRAGSAEGRVALVLDERVTPNDGGYLALSLSGLAPATAYSYAFFNGDDEPSARSLIGHFRTAFPEDWIFPVRIGGLVCTNLRNAPWVALERMADEDLDALVHLGDFSYNDGAVTLPEFRDKWRETLLDSGYQAVLPSAGLYASWDDHEFDNDLNPEQFPAEQLEAAKSAFFEVAPSERGPDGELWTSYRWGRSVEIFVVDARTERAPSRRQSDADAYLGARQLAWLKQGLKDSPCHFKVLLNSVPVTRMSSLWLNAADRWQGYSPAREDLLSFLDDESIDNVWFLSGDFHMGFAGRLEPDGPRRRHWEIAVGPSGNLGNPLGFLVEQGGEEQESVFPQSQFAYGRGRIAMTTLAFDPVLDGVRVRFVDGTTGEVLFDQFLRSGE